ncbi:hypothetical protein D3C85_724440 [compost metagenome]
MNRHRKFYCTFWKDGTPVELHVFTLEPEGKSDYRAIGSYNAFNNNEGKRLLNDPHVMFRGHAVNERDHLLSRQIQADTCARWELTPEPELPVFTHDSIWDMYKAIGYDYKRKRYVRQ